MSTPTPTPEARALATALFALISSRDDVDEINAEGPPGAVRGHAQQARMDIAERNFDQATQAYADAVVALTSKPT